MIEKCGFCDKCFFLEKNMSKNCMYAHAALSTKEAKLNQNPMYVTVPQIINHDLLDLCTYVLCTSLV